jgi:hypothetical protein
VAIWALGVATVLLLGLVVLSARAGRARARALADDVRREVEPYLRRKAAEAGLPGTAPTWTARSTPEEMVTFATTLARRLHARERAGGHDLDELETAQTQPATAPTELKPTP